jgi:hypothetical protein
LMIESVRSMAMEILDIERIFGESCGVPQSP